MNHRPLLLFLAAITISSVCAREGPAVFPEDPLQILERTCFQTAKPWSPQGNLRSDVAVVYGIDKNNLGYRGILPTQHNIVKKTV